MTKHDVNLTNRPNYGNKKKLQMKTKLTSVSTPAYSFDSFVSERRRTTNAAPSDDWSPIRVSDDDGSEPSSTFDAAEDARTRHGLPSFSDMNASCTSSDLSDTFTSFSFAPSTADDRDGAQDKPDQRSLAGYRTRDLGVPARGTPPLVHVGVVKDVGTERIGPRQAGWVRGNGREGRGDDHAELRERRADLDRAPAAGLVSGSFYSSLADESDPATSADPTATSAAPTFPPALAAASLIKSFHRVL